MSADGSARVEFPWGGRLRTFRLGLGEIREVQRVTGFGISHLIQRISLRTYFADDVIEPLRQGLLGAKVPPGEVFALVKRFAEDVPLAESEVPALRVLLSAYDPAEGDALEKREAEKAKNKPTRTGGSSSPPSTASAPSSV